MAPDEQDHVENSARISSLTYLSDFFGGDAEFSDEAGISNAFLPEITVFNYMVKMADKNGALN
jgi:hypothetical protein